MVLERAIDYTALGQHAPAGVEWALPVANRNFIIHQYDEINREFTWLTLSSELPAWKVSLQTLFGEAEMTLGKAG